LKGYASLIGNAVDVLVSGGKRHAYGGLGSVVFKDIIVIKVVGRDVRQITRTGSGTNTLLSVTDFHTDVNLEMNYWFPDRAGLSQCFDPLVDYTYSASYKVPTHVAGEEVWRRRVADNRLELVRDGNKFRILSGM